MNAIHTAIAATVVIPGVVVAGMLIMPSKEDRQAQAAQQAEVAAVEKFRNEEESQPFVLQPFYMSDGVFIVELEARGRQGQSELCGSLPLVHDAVVTALYGKTRNLSTEAIQKRLKQYGDDIRRQINDTFDHPLLKRVVLSYSDLQTFNADHRRKKGGVPARCMSATERG